MVGTLAFSVGESLTSVEYTGFKFLCIHLFSLRYVIKRFPPLNLGTAVMAIFPNVYVSMVMISTMGVISMSISYCPYALLGQYHEIKEVTRTHTR